MESEVAAMYYMMQPLMTCVGLMFVLLVGYVLFYSKSRSRRYRQELADMYVSGKIKKLAKEEGIDINDELIDFMKFTKNKRIDFEELDTTVEREMQEKISGTDTKPKANKK